MIDILEQMFDSMRMMVMLAISMWLLFTWVNNDNGK